MPNYRFLRHPKALFFLFIFSLVPANLILAFTEDMPLPGRVASVCLPVCFLWHTMSWGRCPGRALWAHIWVVFLQAFQLVLLCLWGKGVIAVDMWLNLTHTNANEAGELLGSLVMGLVPVLAGYVIVLTLAAISWRRHLQLPAPFLARQRRRSALALVLSLALAVGARIHGEGKFRIDEHVFPVNVTYNAYLAVKRTVELGGYARTCGAYHIEASSLQPDTAAQVCVYVIGETAWADNFELYGYARPTTPRLMARRAELAVFADALSQSNTTHKSVPMLLTEADAHTAGRLHELRSIFQPFRQAGFHTAFFSSQRMCKDSYIDHFSREAHVASFLHEDGSPDAWDEDLLPVLSRELRRPEPKKFIVLHTYGSHYRYNQRYPRHMAHFLPDSIQSLSAKHREEMLNAYDNSIRYTDHFLAQVMDSVAATGCEATVVYLGDHGEDLYDDERGLFLHASIWPSYYQLHVPFVVWASAPYRQAHPHTWDALLANAAKPVSTSLSAYHTLLQLALVRATRLDPTASVASPEFKTRPRVFLDDRNSPRPLPLSGLEKQDEALFRQHGLVYE